MSTERLEKLWSELLAELFDRCPPDPSLDAGELLRRAPRRLAKAWTEDLLAGAGTDPAALLRPIEMPAARGPVLLSGIAFTAVCAHHLLPFRGVAHAGYVPEGRHAGLGAVARVVDACARRLTLQEALTASIADGLERGLSPRSLVVAVEAEHQCLSARGPRKAGHRFVTVERRGAPSPELEALVRDAFR